MKIPYKKQLIYLIAIAGTYFDGIPQDIMAGEARRNEPEIKQQYREEAPQQYSLFPCFWPRLNITADIKKEGIV